METRRLGRVTSQRRPKALRHYRMTVPILLRVTAIVLGVLAWPRRPLSQEAKKRLARYHRMDGMVAGLSFPRHRSGGRCAGRRHPQGPLLEKHFGESFNERQIRVLNRMLDGFEGKLTSSKWAKLAQCSQDTAYRDITDLVTRGVLRKDSAGGRSTSYSLTEQAAE